MDVDLCGNQITVLGIPLLAAGIQASPSLAEISLDNNDLREEGGRALLEAAQGNGGLVKVGPLARSIMGGRYGSYFFHNNLIIPF